MTSNSITKLSNENSTHEVGHWFVLDARPFRVKSDVHLEGLTRHWQREDECTFF